MTVQYQIADTRRRPRHNPVDSMDEIVALCPKCKTMETLWLIRGKLSRTQKFIQENDAIYHTCGSTEPCRLLARFWNGSGNK
jgi:hypothetical protein